MRLLKKISLLTVIFCNTALQASTISDEVRLEGGYRHDKYRHSFTTEAAIPGGPTFVNTEEFRINDVDLGTFGIKARFFVPNWWDCEGFASKKTNFYITGFTNWGWAGKESYRDTIISGFTPVTTQYSGHLSYVNTYDYNIGLGYYLDFGCLNYCLNRWGLGVSGGYQWDKQMYEVDTASATINGIPTSGAIEQDLYIYQRWEGPWVGAQVFYDYCGWRFDVGYEYHFSLYTRGRFDYTSEAIALGASDQTWHGHKGYSNVAYINWYYDLCKCWNVGIGFKYQDWHSKAQTNTSDPSLVGVETLSSSNNSQAWAYSLYGSVGYHF